MSPLQQNETVDLGEVKVSSQRATVYTVGHIGASLAVVLYDDQAKVGGIAHVVLPESALSGGSQPDEAVGKYADLAIPALVSAFLECGGDKLNAHIKVVGGAQLFNFGGGAGNLLNIGARNLTAIRTALSKEGLVVDQEDVGGNKAKSLRFLVASGQVAVQQIGGQEYTL